MRTILMANCKDELANVLKMVGIHCIRVKENQQNQLLGCLLNIKDYGVNVSPCTRVFRDEMIVFFDFNDQQLDEVLALLKSIGQNIALKAIATETNLNWPLTLLHDELVKEHLAMNRRSNN